MGLNKVSSYIGNVGRSVKFMSIDTLRGMGFEPITDFASQNNELFKEIYSGMKNYRTTYQRTNRLIKKSVIYDSGNKLIKNVISDIKTGNLYNKQRIDQYEMEAMGMEDLIDGSTANIDDNVEIEISAEDKRARRTESVIDNAAMASSNMISSTVAKTGQFIASNIQVSDTMRRVENTQIMHGLATGFGSVQAGINKIIQFAAGPLESHLQNSKIYYENSIKLMQEQNAMFKEFLEMQREQYKEKIDDNKKKKLGYDDVVDANGMPDLKTYGAIIKKNSKSIISDLGLDMILGDGFGGKKGSMLNAILANPIGALGGIAIKALIPQMLKNTAQQFSDTLSGLFSNIIGRFNRMAKENGIAGFIGKLFGIRNKLQSDVKVGEYKKGAVPFDGITRNAIINIIPSYLRRIEAAVSGREERIYNSDSGKWETASSYNESYNNAKKSYRDKAVGDTEKEMHDYIKKLGLDDIKEEKKLLEGMSKLLTNMYEQGGTFNFGKKKKLDSADYGFSGESQLFENLIAILNSASFKTGGKRGNKNIMSLDRNIIENRKAQTEYMSNASATGIWEMIANGDINPAILKEESKKAKKDPNYKANNPFNFLDRDGNSAYYYMRNILAELRLHRELLKNNGRPRTRQRSQRNRSTSNSRSSSGSDDDDDGASITINGQTINLNNIDDSDLDKLVRSAKELSQNQIDRNRDFRDAERHRENARRTRERYGIRNNIDTYADNSSARIAGEIVNQRILQEIDERNSARNSDSSIIRATRRNSAAYETRRRNARDGKGSFMDMYRAAQTASEKFNVIKEGMAKIASKPAEMLSSVIETADTHLYNFFFGEEDERDADGNPIKGFIGKMTNELRDSFNKFNNFMSEKLFKPMLNKLGINSFEDIPRKLVDLLGGEGTYDALKERARGKVGEFLKPYGEAVKTSFRKAKDDVVDAFDSVRNDYYNFRDINSRRGSTLNQKITDEQAEALRSRIQASRTARQNGYSNISANDYIESQRQNRTESKNRRAEAGTSAIAQSINDMRSYSTTYERIQRMIDAGRRNEISNRDWDRYAEYKRAKNNKESLKMSSRSKTILDELNILKKKRNLTPEEKERMKQLKSEYNKIKNKASSVGGLQLSMFANGARYITKSGITTISEGEMIIPSELNPYNPYRFATNKAAEIANEEAIKSRFSNRLANAIKSRIHRNAEGDQPITASDAENALGSDAAQERTIRTNGKIIDPNSVIGTLQSAVGTTAFRLFGKEGQSQEDFSKATAEAMSVIKKNAPEIVGNSAVGGSLGLLLTPILGPMGGIMMGAAAGAAKTIIGKSESLQNVLFGEIGEDGEREGGMISKNLQQNFTKYFPDMKNYGIVGGLTLFPLLGPIGGIIAGSALGFAKNNTAFQDYLFGQVNPETGKRDLEEGLIGGANKEKIKKAFPAIGAGALATIALGPFGLVGNAVLGSGIGLMSTTDKFKDIVLGTEDENGNRTGGILGAVKTGVIEPIKDSLTGIKERVSEFIDEDILEPLKDFVEPFSNGAKHFFGSLLKTVGHSINVLFENTLGIPLDRLIKEKIIEPLNKMVKNTFKMLFAPLKTVISAPFKFLGGIGNSIKKRQIKRGNAEYVTADDRMKFRSRHRFGHFNLFKKSGGNDRYLAADEILANWFRDENGNEFDRNSDQFKSQADEMSALAQAASTAAYTDEDFFIKRKNNLKRNTSDKVSKWFENNKRDTKKDRKRIRDKILRAINDGDPDKASKILNSKRADFSEKEAEELNTMILEFSEDHKLENERRQSVLSDGGIFDKAKAELEKKFGIKNIKTKDVSRLASYLNTELKSHGLKKEKANINTPQEAMANLDVSTQKMVGFQEEIVNILKDKTTGENPLLSGIQESMEKGVAKALERLQSENENRRERFNKNISQTGITDSTLEHLSPSEQGFFERRAANGAVKILSKVENPEDNTVSAVIDRAVNHDKTTMKTLDRLSNSVNNFNLTENDVKMVQHLTPRKRRQINKTGKLKGFTSMTDVREYKRLSNADRSFIASNGNKFRDMYSGDVVGATGLEQHGLMFGSKNERQKIKDKYKTQNPPTVDEIEDDIQENALGGIIKAGIGAAKFAKNLFSSKKSNNTKNTSKVSNLIDNAKSDIENNKPTKVASIVSENEAVIETNQKEQAKILEESKKTNQDMVDTANENLDVDKQQNMTLKDIFSEIKKIATAQDRSLMQKITDTGGVIKLVRGKDGGVKPSNDKETNDTIKKEEKQRGIFGRIADSVSGFGSTLKGLFTGGEDKDTGGETWFDKIKNFLIKGLGGATIAAGAGHIANNWPEIKDFLSTHFWDPVKKWLGDKAKDPNSFVNKTAVFLDNVYHKVASWITGDGKYVNAKWSLPGLIKGYASWMETGLIFFGEKVLPKAISIIIKTLPSLIKGIVIGIKNGIASLLKPLFPNGGYKGQEDVEIEIPGINSIDSSKTPVSTALFNWVSDGTNTDLNSIYGGTSGNLYSGEKLSFRFNENGDLKVENDLSQNDKGSALQEIMSGISPSIDNIGGYSIKDITSGNISSAKMEKAVDDYILQTGGDQTTKQQIMEILNSKAPVDSEMLTAVSKIHSQVKGRSTTDEKRQAITKILQIIRNDPNYYKSNILDDEQVIEVYNNIGKILASNEYKDSKLLLKAIDNDTSKYLNELDKEYALNQGEKRLLRGAAYSAITGRTPLAFKAISKVGKIVSKAPIKVFKVGGKAIEYGAKGMNNIFVNAAETGNIVKNTSTSIKNSIGTLKTNAANISKATDGATDAIKVAKGIDTAVDAADTAADVTKSATRGSNTILQKIINWVTKKIDDLFSSPMLAKIINKFSKSKVNQKILQPIGKQIGKLVSKVITSKIGQGAANLGKQFLKMTTSKAFILVTALVDFAWGCDNAASIMGVSAKTSDISFGDRITAGLVHTLTKGVTFGFIEGQQMYDLIYGCLKEVFHLEDSELAKEREQAQAELDAYNLENGTNISLDEYNDQFTITGKIKSKAKDAWNATKEGASKAWNWTKDKAGKAWDKTKEVAGKAWNKTKEVAGKAWNGIKTGTKNAANYLTGNIFNDDKIREELGLAEGTEITLQDRISMGAATTLNKLTFGLVDTEDSVKKINGAIEIVKGKAEETWSSIKESTSKAWEDTKKNVKEGLNKADEKLGSLMGMTDEEGNPISLTDGVKKDWTDFKKSATESWNNLKKDTSEAWESLKGNAKEKWDDLKDKASKGFQKIDEKLGAMFGMVDENGKVLSLTDGVKKNWESVKDKASKGWNGLKDKVSETWDGIKSWFSNLGKSLENASDSSVESRNNGKGKKKSRFGKGKISQLDPSIAGIQYNGHTIGEAGCGPVAATNLINNMTGENISVEDAANFAVRGGFKPTNDGTNPAYMNTILNASGIPTSDVSGRSGIRGSLIHGNPVVIMGRGSTNTSPYGNQESPHYITAMGYDSNGNVIVDDPYENGYQSYSESDVVNGAIKSISAGGYGKRKNRLFGRGKHRFGFGIDEALKTKVIYKTTEITNGAEGAYDTIIKNDNGSWSVGIAGFHGSKIKELFTRMANKLSGNSKQQALKFATWEKYILNDSQANEVKNFLHSNSSVAKEVEEAYMKEIVGSNISVPLEMYNAGTLKDYRSIILAADIGNTGPTHLKDWKPRYSPTSQDKELAHVKDSLKSSDSWWGRATGSKYYKGWMNRIENTYNALKNWSAEGYNPSTGSSSSGTTESGGGDYKTSTLFGAIGDLGVSIAKSIYGEDIYNAIAGESSGSQNNNGNNNGTPGSSQSSEVKRRDGSTVSGPVSDNEHIRKAQISVANAMYSRQGLNSYSQNGSLREKQDSGYSDCSSMVSYAYRKGLNNNVALTNQLMGATLPGWSGYTGSEWQKGTLVSNTKDTSKLQVGDLLFWGKNGSTSHVEMYTGDDTIMGHGRDIGPTEKKFTTYSHPHSFMGARRYITEDIAKQAGFGKKHASHGMGLGIGRNQSKPMAAKLINLQPSYNSTDLAAYNNSSIRSNSIGNTSNNIKLLKIVIETILKVVDNTDKIGKIYDILAEKLNIEDTNTSTEANEKESKRNKISNALKRLDTRQTFDSGNGNTSEVSDSDISAIVKMMAEIARE